MKSHRTPQLNSYHKITLGSVAAMAAGGSTEAAIVYFDVNPDETLVGSSFGYVTFGSINLGAGTYSKGSSAGDFFAIGMDFGGDLFSGHYFGTVQWGLSPTDYTGGTPFQPTRVQKLGYGTSISDISAGIGSWVNYGPYMAYNGTGPWAGGGNAYAPLRINAGGGDYNYGWVNINFTDNGDGTSSSTITGFAFESDLNTAILAGDTGAGGGEGGSAVPEPSSVALIALGGLFGLAARRGLRQEQEESPVMSERLMHLASGARGVEQLRADKAA